MQFSPSFRSFLLIFPFAISVLSIPCTASGCLNDYVITEDGRVMESFDFEIRDLQGFISLDYLHRITGELNPDLASTYEFKDQINISVSLIKTGAYEEALVILEPLAIEYPDSYTVHANLGTLYELMGHPEAALTHIQKGIELNPESHQGSEWIHVKILEAKLAMEKDPNWLASNKVLGPLTAENLYTAYSHGHFQVASRIPFSPQPSPILSQLCGELGEFLAQQQSVQRGHQYFLLAQYYAEDPTTAYTDRIAELEKIHADENKNPKRARMDFVELATREQLINTENRIWHNERVFISGDLETVFSKDSEPAPVEVEPEFECAHAAGYAQEQEINAQKSRFNSRLLFGITALVGLCILGIGIYMAVNKKKKR